MDDVALRRASLEDDVMDAPPRDPPSSGNPDLLAPPMDWDLP